MRQLAFIIAMLGIFLLAGIFYFSKPINVNGPEELSMLNDNQKVIISGIAEDERFNARGSIFYINEIRIICTGCRESYLDSEVAVEGVLERYNYVIEVEALIVKIQ